MHRFLTGLLALMAAAVTQAADLNVMPVAVQLDRGHDRTTVHVTNNGSEPVLVQAETIAWKREGGVDRDEPSDGLLINPGVFTIAPGKTQVVRVGLRRNVPADSETTYRMVLREVPVPTAADAMGVQGTVRVLVTLRLPVYVAPNAVRRDERWVARYDTDGNLVAQISNQGNVHYKVGSIRVAGEADNTTLVAQGPESVLFPGEVRNFRLPARAARAEAQRTQQPLTLEVMTDRGVQHVALDLTPR